MRIIVGVGDVAGMVHEVTNGLRLLDVKADSIVRAENKFYKKKHTYTFNFSTVSKWVDIDSQENKAWRTALKIFERTITFVGILFLFPYFLIRYSHVILISVESSFLYRMDLPVWRFFGKKIIFFCVGSDIRHVSAFHQEIGGDLSTWEDVLKNRDINWNLRNLRGAELYGDSVFSAPDQSGLSLRPYYHLPIPMDLSKYKYSLTGNDIPKIVHAPSRSGAKGTAKILSALERLKQEGYIFSLQLLHGVSNQVVLDTLTESDILVDEIYAHGPAKLGFEAMASGCAVANRFYPGSFEPAIPPVCHIDENNLYEPLKKLITDKQYRVQLAVDGRNFVEKHQNSSVIARRIMDCIENKPRYDYYPVFFLRKYKLPPGKQISPRYLKRGKKVVMRYGSASLEDVKRGIEEKLIAPFTEAELRQVKIWTNQIN